MLLPEEDEELQVIEVPRVVLDWIVPVDLIEREDALGEEVPRVCSVACEICDLRPRLLGVCELTESEPCAVLALCVLCWSQVTSRGVSSGCLLSVTRLRLDLQVGVDCALRRRHPDPGR